MEINDGTRKTERLFQTSTIRLNVHSRGLSSTDVVGDKGRNKDIVMAGNTVLQVLRDRVRQDEVPPTVVATGIPRIGSTTKKNSRSIRS